MYCPDCGTTTSLDQKFCRSCGLDLTEISEALTRRHSAAKTNDLDENPPDEAPAPTPVHRRKIFRLGFVLFWIGLLMILGTAIGGDAIKHINETLGATLESFTGLGVLPLLLGVALLASSSIMEGTPRSSRRRPPSSLAAKKETVKLPPAANAEPVPSVTEHTTYKLDVPGETR